MLEFYIDKETIAMATKKPSDPMKMPRISALEKKLIDAMQTRDYDGMRWLMENGARPGNVSYKFAAAFRDRKRIEVIDNFFSEKGISNTMSNPDILFDNDPNTDIEFWKFLYERESRNPIARLGSILNKRDKKTPLAIDPTEGFNLLAMACGPWESSKAVAFLLEKGHSPKSKSGRPAELPIFRCAGGDNPQIVRLLTEAGSPFDLANHMGDLPIHTACYSGSPDVIETVLEAAPSYCNTYGRDDATPLLILTNRPDIPAKTLFALLDAGANPNMASGGTTPMEAAAAKGNQPFLSAIDSFTLNKTVSTPEKAKAAKPF